MKRVLILDGSIHRSIYQPTAGWRRWLGEMESDSVHLPSGEPVPLLSGYTHLIVTGSEASIVDDDAWFEVEAAVVRDAAAFVASFSPKAVREGTPVTVRVAGPDGMTEVTVTPARTTPLGWGELNWQGVREEIRADARARALPVPEGNDDGPDGQSE